MTSQHHPSDLDLAALISSKICHDAIGPVGAIQNGLEILEADDSPDARAYALQVIKDVSAQASARLQFARFAFGASGSAGSSIELDMARDLAIGFVGGAKHTLTWQGPSSYMAKDPVKLLLNLVASAVTALPRGGSVAVEISGEIEKPVFALSCSGRGARRPNFLSNLVDGGTIDEIDAMSVQAYYTWRLAQQADMTITISDAHDDRVEISARAR